MSTGSSIQFGNLDQAIKAAGEARRPGEDFEPKFLEPEMSWEQFLALELHSMLSRLAIAAGFDDPRPSDPSPGTQSAGDRSRALDALQ